MKKIIVLAVFFLVAGAVFGQEFTFRGLPWGATQEQVIAVLGQPQINNWGGWIFYANQEIAGYRAGLHLRSIAPDFRLVEATYQINFSTIDEAQAIYSDLLAKLSVLYGTPNTNTSSHYWVVKRTLIRLGYGSHENILVNYQSPEINEYGNL